MKHSLLITALVAFPLFVTSSALALEGRQRSPVFGKVTTNKKLALKAAPNAHAAAETVLDANTDLRWVMGELKGKYVRVMISKGTSGWVLEADVKKVAEADLASIALEAQAQPCVESGHLERLHHEKAYRLFVGGQPSRPSQPIEENGSTRGNTHHPDVRSLLAVAERGCRVSRPRHREIDPAERDKIKSINTADGTVGEGSRVRLVAVLSDGTPHPNTGKSVNCNLKKEPNNDIHISVAETKNASAFEEIVVREMIPQDRPENWTSAEVDTLRGKVLSDRRRFVL